MTKVEILRDKTYKEAVSCLQRYGKCAIIRPTGFGKTGLLTRLIRSRRYNKILYLYPAKVIKNTVLDFYYMNSSYHKDYIPNVTFMTYSKLARLKDSDIEQIGADGFDLIICDECHKLGATETMNGLHTLLNTYPNIHILGATATPERMDMIDEIAMFFDDRIVSKYTLHNALQDGILQKPYYCFCANGETDAGILAGIKKEAKLEIKKIDDKDERKYATELLDSRIIEISKLLKMENVISETLKETNVDTIYQKYIIFFRNHSLMNENMKKVKKWFKKSFPNHSIKELIISSENDEYHDNVNLLDTLEYKENHIDLIYCCDMLNMGYHVDNLTGILMYRGTHSSIIYVQQLGRALSTGDSEPKIVFDIVDNIHRQSMYSTLEEDDCSSSQLSKEEIEDYSELVKRTIDKNDDGDPIPLTEEEMERFIELSRKLKSRDDSEGKTTNRENALHKSDLIVTGYQATLKEIIAKTIAEPAAMRCRQAWFRWIEKGGDASIMTRDYILGRNTPQHVPLAPFCRLKHVTVNAVLKEMGVT